MSTRLRMVLASALMSLGLGGCAYGELHQVLRAQVASELSCPEVAVKSKGLAYTADDEDLNRYLVTGCGVTRTYTCPEDEGLVSYDEPVCSFEEGNSDAPELAVMPTDEGAFGDEAEADADAEESEPPAEPAATKAPTKKPAKAEGTKAPAKKPAKAEGTKAPAKKPGAAVDAEGDAPVDAAPANDEPDDD